MHQTTLIIGGCRSGKSKQALIMGEAVAAARKLFVATCIPQDTEMEARVNRHQHERGPDWLTLEAPLELVETLSRQAKSSDIVVVDCLTLWISNLTLSCADDAALAHRIDELCTFIDAPPCPILLVSNEVGTGIVPENALARRFRDLVGRANQQVAASAQQVIWMVAGIPVSIKPRPEGQPKIGGSVIEDHI